MDKKKLKGLIKQRLLEIKKTNAQSAQSQQTVVLDQSRVGRLSRMDAMQVQEINKQGQRRRDIEKQRLELALSRINAADYGECAQCTESIGAGRLELDPAATYCIHCAKQLENA